MPTLPLRIAFCLLGMLAMVAASVGASGQSEPEVASGVTASRAAGCRHFFEELDSLAGKIEQAGNPRLAAATLGWAVQGPPDRQLLFLGDREAGHPVDSFLSDDKRWNAELSRARDQYADVLWSLTEAALDKEESEKAVQRLYEILWVQKDDHRARRALGLLPSGKPRRDAEPRLARNPQHAYGWAARSYWRVQTEHFLITTNHGAEEAKRLAVILEELYTAWRQMFVSYSRSATAVCQAIGDHGLREKSAVRHRVVLFRTKKEYVRYLRRYEPQVEMTLGIYRDADRTAYFFAGEDGLEPTWRHEVAHQLFFETTKRSPSVGREHNFWLVEGVALYLESLRRADGYCFVGGVDARRLQFARYRGLNEKFYVPLVELCRMGRSEMQSDPRLRQLYSQAAGLTHFLMDADQGKFRQGTVAMLGDIYAGIDEEHSLEERLDLDFEALDRAYMDYLRVDDKQMRELPEDAETKMLSLGYTNVTDQGLSFVARLKHLEWLDVAACAITDEGFRNVPTTLPLRRLNLEATRITDESVRRAGEFRDLEELDLSDTQITDAGLEGLRDLKRLQVLWLTGTQVTDRGLAVIGQLPRLKTLDVGRSQVTATAWREFRQSHPQLNQKSQR